MKKIISLVLIMLLSLNSISATFAGSSDGELEKNINVKYVDGVYLSGSRANMKAKITKEIGVYELKDGKLIIDTGMGVYLPVDRVEINLVNLEQVEKVKQDMIDSNFIAKYQAHLIIEEESIFRYYVDEFKGYVSTLSKSNYEGKADLQFILNEIDTELSRDDSEDYS